MQQHKLFVGSVPAKTTSSDLLSVLNKLVKDVSIISKLKNGQVNAGFCIIATQSLLSFKLLMESKVVLGDRILDFKPYVQGNGLKIQKINENKRRLIVHNIPYELINNNQDFEQEFVKFGQLEKFFLMSSDKKLNGQIVLLGHAIFKSQQSVNQALLRTKQTIELKTGHQLHYESYIAFLEEKRLRKIEKTQARKATLQQRIALKRQNSQKDCPSAEIDQLQEQKLEYSRNANKPLKLSTNLE